MCAGEQTTLGILFLLLMLPFSANTQWQPCVEFSYTFEILRASRDDFPNAYCSLSIRWHLCGPVLWDSVRTISSWCHLNYSSISYSFFELKLSPESGSTHYWSSPDVAHSLSLWINFYGGEPFGKLLFSYCSESASGCMWWWLGSLGLWSTEDLFFGPLHNISIKWSKFLIRHKLKPWGKHPSKGMYSFLLHQPRDQAQLYTILPECHLYKLDLTYISPCK